MDEIIQEALSKGIEMHVAGEFDLASQLYASVLKLQPNHADANHNMGVLKLTTGYGLEALTFLQTALQANTNVTRFWLSYIKALINLDRLDEAGRILDLAKESGIESEEFVELDQLLNAPTENAVVVDAEVDTPNPPQDKIHQLVNLYNHGQLAAVVEQANILTAQYPDAFMIWNILGIAAAKTGQIDRAIIAFQRVLAIKPDYAEASYNLGKALQNQGKLDEAIASYNKALSLKPDYAEAFNNMGNALKEQGKPDEAIASYNKALSLKPDYADAYNNMGVTLREHGKPDEAIASYNKALSLKPDYAEAYNNMGNVLQDQGKLEEAVASYNKALSLKPYYAEAHENLSFALLNIGELKKGLEEYEWRWKSTKNSEMQRKFSIPVWDGQKNLQYKRILLWSEQGLGDTINWSSRLPLILSQAQHCTLECSEKLVPLLRRSFPNVEIKSEDRSRDLQRDDFDFHLPLGSLYRHFIPQILNNPKPDAFLIPDPTRINFWIKRLKSLGPGPYIGVSWKSSDMSPKRLPNYAPISDWCPIFKIDGITFINLQYVDYESDLAKIKSEFGVTVHNFDDLDHYNNIDDVAALCAALDMVVSTKITVPLISSGVGTITKLANWRQSPWNNILLNPVGPEIDIFEKNTWESWDNVFNKIAADIFKMKTRLNSTSESL